jgi:non-specific serine/threonine protein kinase
MAVADICRRLDGIPLALELAAARARALSVETMAARLSDRFRLLTGGDRTALPRQQTLRACIDWSYDLLTENECALLRRLAVFAGGFMVAAAESVGAGGAVDTTDVLDLLGNLVQKSLVEFEAEGGRYRLLETVRQYARERLDEAGEGDAARTRHLVFYAALTQQAFWKVQGPDQRAWMSRLDFERENLLAAHAWCDRAEEGGELGLRLVNPVRGYWLHRGLLELGFRVTVEALARAGAQQRSLQRCWTLQAAGLLSFWMGSYEVAQEFGKESLSIARETGDARSVAFVLILVGMVFQAQDERGKARGCLEEALAISRDPGNQHQLAYALNALAELYRADGNLDAAEPLYDEALLLQRELGNSNEIAICSLNLARVAIERGLADRARTMLLEALAIAGEIGSRLVGQFVLDISAWLAAFLGERALAARFYGAAEAQLEQTRYHRESVDEAPIAPLITRACEALGAAAFAAAKAAGRALSYEQAMAEARAWLENRA